MIKVKNDELLIELLKELNEDMEKEISGMKIWYDEEFAQIEAQHKKELSIKEARYKKELVEKEKIHAIELATKDQEIAKLKALLKWCCLKNSQEYHS